MGTITRGSLPSNFLDSVSAGGLRLPTPEPQYFFAKMALGARLGLGALDAGAATVQQFVSMMGGGDNLSPDLAEMARAADAYQGAVKAVDAFGLGMGDTVKFERDVYTAGLTTEASRILQTGQTISTTGQIIQEEQVPVVLQQYIGPNNGTSNLPYSIADFDAKYRANKEALASKVTRHLRRDYTRWLDAVIRDRFRATTNVTYSDSVANVASFTAGAGHIANLEMIFNGRKSLSDREWAKFSNGRYMCLVPTKFNTDMIGDVDYREMSKVHMEGRNLIYGYIGSVQDVDFFECSTLKTYAAGDTVEGSTVPASVTVQEALLFGPGVVGMGTALAPECRWLDDTNAGTLAKCIWYALHAFQTLDSRGVQRMLFQ